MSWCLPQLSLLKTGDFHHVSMMILIEIPGNYYSFANTQNKDARLFFTQGCVPTNDDDSVPGSATKPGAMDGDSSTPTGRPTSVKGRPRGKQKAGGRKAT